eukprot:SAG22_NODE_450_length_10398_cov_8.760171_5_plen_111_part_00
MKDVTVEGLRCNDSTDGLRFKTPRPAHPCTNFTFKHVSMVGVATALSVAGVSGVAYTDVNGSKVQKPGSFEYCSGISLTNVRIETPAEFSCGTDTADMHAGGTVLPKPCW